MRMCTLAATAAIAMLSGSATAAEPWPTQARENAVMLYFSKSFGSDQKQNRAPLAFGLRFQQQPLFESMPPLALFDARYSLGGRKQLLIGGLNAFEASDSGPNSSEASSGEGPSGSSEWSQRHPGWTIAIVVASIAAGACILNYCDDEDEEEDTSEGTGAPGTGT